VTLALELLEKDGRAHLLASIEEYADNLTRGTYFRLQRRVLSLSLAACFRLAAVATQMLRLGAPTDSVDSNGETALHRAVASGHSETSAVLLDHGASINA
jgi:ankyrin repeat protein